MPKAAQARLSILIFSLLVILFLGIIDTITGYEISLSIFYIAPIALASWYANKQIGRTVALCAAVVWLIADLQTGQTFSQTWIPFWNSAVRLVWFWVVASYLAEMKEKIERERQPNRIDPITGAYNGWAFYHRAEKDIRLCHAQNTAVTIAYIDCQRKESASHKTWGEAKLNPRHDADLWLSSIVQTIQPRLHATDTLARISGGNFALVLPGTNGTAARLKLEILLDSVIAAMLNEQFPVQCSIAGVTMTPAPATLSEAIDRADELLLTIKNAPPGTLRHETVSTQREGPVNGDTNSHINNSPIQATTLLPDPPLNHTSLNEATPLRAPLQKR